MAHTAGEMLPVSWGSQSDSSVSLLGKLRPPNICVRLALCALQLPRDPGAYSMPALRCLAWFLQVSRPVMENVPYALRIETAQSCLTLSARYGWDGASRELLCGYQPWTWHHFPSGS